MYSYTIDKSDKKIIGEHTVYRLISPFGKKCGYGTSALVVEPASSLPDPTQENPSANTLSTIGEDVVLINCRVSGCNIVGDTIIEDSWIKCSRVRDSKIKCSKIYYSQVTLSEIEESDFDYLVVGNSHFLAVDAKIALDQKRRNRFVSSCSIDDSSLKGFFDVSESNLSNCFFGICNGNWGYYSGNDLIVSNAEINSSTDIFLNTVYDLDGCNKTIYAYKSKKGNWLFRIDRNFSKNPFEEACESVRIFDFQKYDGKKFYDFFLSSVQKNCPDLFKNGKPIFCVFDEEKVNYFCLVQMCTFVFNIKIHEEKRNRFYKNSSIVDIRGKKRIVPFIVNDMLLTDTKGKIPIAFSIRYNSIQSLKKIGFSVI